MVHFERICSSSLTSQVTFDMSELLRLRDYENGKICVICFIFTFNSIVISKSAGFICLHASTKKLKTFFLNS